MSVQERHAKNHINNHIFMWFSQNPTCRISQGSSKVVERDRKMSENDVKVVESIHKMAENMCKVGDDD